MLQQLVTDNTPFYYAPKITKLKSHLIPMLYHKLCNSLAHDDTLLFSALSRYPISK